MPDRASTPVYDKCTSCAFASEKGPVCGPWPTSHTDVCCLYKFNRQEQSALCQDKDVGQKANGTCDGLCKNCPSRLKFPQLQIELPVEEPSQRSSDVTSQEGTTDVPQSCTSVQSRTPKSSKIAPRKRRGFTKLTIEIRPPRFKKKLWFGTWQEEEIARAKDAINYYMGSNEPFILPDSPLIFAQHPLGIEYRELKPSCEEFVQVGQKQVRASVYFARRVKEVIKAVTRGKKKAHPPKKPLKPKPGAFEKILESQQIEVTQRIHEPPVSFSSGSPSSMIVPCPSGSTSSSVMPCASGSQLSTGDDMVWYGASSEVHSGLAVVQPSYLPHSEMLPYEGEIPFEPELFSLICDWGEEGFSLEGITFSNSPPDVAASGEGEDESGMIEDSGFLWS
ncbi:hypothetical protein M758_4G098600 [Ceratodon purpureus]|nr:hypothetical protein M758_4G098600 [Ceratodon purpureus]